MSERKLGLGDIDKALENLQKSAVTDDVITLQKGMTIDKRAMGGDVKNEEDPSGPSKGRSATSVNDPEVGRVPASKLSGNFAEQWHSAEGLEAAAAADGVHKNPEPNRGLSKAVDEKSVESEKSEDSSIKKAVDEKSGENSSKNSMKKAVVPKEESADKSGDSSIKKAVDEKSGENSSKNSMKKAVVPKEESADKSGAASGAARLKVSAKGDVKKAIDLVASAHKHLSKAFEDGDENSFGKAGERLLSAKHEILKAIEIGTSVNPRIVEKIEKAGNYFCKAIETYEKEDGTAHVDAVTHAKKNMQKAIDTFHTIEKSVKADEALKIVKNGKKYVMEMTEEQYKNVYKSIVKNDLYKSLDGAISEDTRKTIDAVPAIKELFKSLTASNDLLRDTILDQKVKDSEFKKSVLETVQVLGASLKDTKSELDALKGIPAQRKSVLSVQESPLAKSMNGSNAVDVMDRNRISVILEKGVMANILDQKTLFAWDIDKDDVVIPEKYVEICKGIEARIK